LKKCKCQRAVLITILLINVMNILLILIFHNIRFWKIFTYDLFWTIFGIVAATVISLLTHRSILKRDKKINTIAEFSKIRTKYPDLSCMKAAKCRSWCEFKRKRIAYLKEMEFFCVGLNNGVFDINILKKMSGHLLVTQYRRYMRKVAFSRLDKGFEYQEYIKVMETLCEDYAREGYKK